MNKLEDNALKFMSGFLEKSKSPIVMCSFGKDSLVVLHLAKKLNKKIPVLFLREPFLSKKYKFANRLIEKLDLWVYDYNPFATDFVYNNSHLDIVSLYDLGQGDYNYKPIGLKPIINGNKLICSVNDILQRPKGRFDYQWDLSFHGHKDADVDPLHGTIKLSNDGTKPIGNTLWVYPLKDWTDDDVWYYIKKNKVSYDKKRYDGNIDYNTDYVECCYDCLDPNLNSMVDCPLEKKKILNIGKISNYKEKFSFYIGQEKRR